MAIKKRAQSGHQHFLNPAIDHLAIQFFFCGSAERYFFRAKPFAEEIADNFIIALPIHALEHCTIGLNTIAQIETHPRLAMNGIGIHQHAIHIENQRQTFGEGIPNRRLC